MPQGTPHTASARGAVVALTSFFTVLTPTLMSTSVLAAEAVELAPITITAPAAHDESTDADLGATRLGGDDLAAQRGTTRDTGELLQAAAGMSAYAAGGISSLPALHGLADDRLSIRVDGVDLTPACPNHMNAPLSYVDPTKIASVRVFSGITPVSVGGDSLGGSVQVLSVAPEFAPVGERLLGRAHVGSFYRSNGNAYGYQLGATAAGPWLSATYDESSSRSDNYTAGASFKSAAVGREGGPLLAGDVVGSSAYHGSTNRALSLAVHRETHLLMLAVSRQTVDFEGFPNQRMDLTSNDNRLANLRYTGQFAWGDLEGQLSYQYTRHAMDMGPDRYSYGTGMPMDAKARTRNARLQANLLLGERHLLRLGVEYQYYTLFDWWSPVGGVMGPNAFWNLDFGQRSRLDGFAEWESHWSDRWTSQLGLRSDNVWTSAGAVQGYDNGLAASWGNDAAAFNAESRERSDRNWDLAALLRYAPGARASYQAGYARKSRSPNLYQRYAWSTNAMAALMNNFAGDGNGYIGNLALRPEVAHTLSATADWHGTVEGRWKAEVSAHYTRVQGFIDARRCDFSQCSANNPTADTGFVLLQYANQSARLYGVDVAGQLALVQESRWGQLAARGSFSYLRGDNLTTGAGLYNIMPPNGRLSLLHRWRGWTAAPELLVVADKNHLSHVRNEMHTDGYWLLNLRGGYQWKHARLDFAVENLFDRFYSSPLGGAYLGQGPSMTSNGIPWGTPVPGRGRSLNLSFGLFY